MSSSLHLVSADQQVQLLGEVVSLTDLPQACGYLCYLLPPVLHGSEVLLRVGERLFGLSVGPPTPSVKHQVLRTVGCVVQCRTSPREDHGRSWQPQAARRSERLRWHEPPFLLRTARSIWGPRRPYP